MSVSDTILLICVCECESVSVITCRLIDSSSQPQALKRHFMQASNNVLTLCDTVLYFTCICKGKDVLVHVTKARGTVEV